jgi:hypothetical protein
VVKPAAPSGPFKSAGAGSQKSWRSSAHANELYERYRTEGRMRNGRRFGAPPKPFSPPATPAGKVNLTDPDSRLVYGMRGWIQGYNAQAVATSST